LIIAAIGLGFINPIITTAIIEPFRDLVCYLLTKQITQPVETEGVFTGRMRNGGVLGCLMTIAPFFVMGGFCDLSALITRRCQSSASGLFERNATGSGFHPRATLEL
jgi:hypothetical protein